MFNDHVTRPHHFLIPTIIAIIGGLFVRLDGWEDIGYTIWAIAGANTAFLFYTGIQAARLRLIQEQNVHMVEMQKVDLARSHTKLTIDKTSLEGNELSWSETRVNIAPYKLKVFAEGVLSGRKMTIREWTPMSDGKTFSDTEWRHLMEFMKQPVSSRPQIKFIVPKNPDDERKGYELTKAGRSWLEGLLETRVLTPSMY